MTEENLYLRYLPWLEESDTIIITLKAMGLSHRNITKILCGGEAIIIYPYKMVCKNGLTGMLL